MNKHVTHEHWQWIQLFSVHLTVKTHLLCYFPHSVQFNNRGAALFWSIARHHFCHREERIFNMTMLKILMTTSAAPALGYFISDITLVSGQIVTERNQPAISYLSGISLASFSMAISLRGPRMTMGRLKLAANNWPGLKLVRLVSKIVMTSPVSEEE